MRRWSHLRGRSSRVGSSISTRSKSTPARCLPISTTQPFSASSPPPSKTPNSDQYPKGGRLQRLTKWWNPLAVRHRARRSLNFGKAVRFLGLRRKTCLDFKPPYSLKQIDESLNWALAKSVPECCQQEPY